MPRSAIADRVRGYYDKSLFKKFIRKNVIKHFIQNAGNKHGIW